MEFKTTQKKKNVSSVFPIFFEKVYWKKMIKVWLWKSSPLSIPDSDSSTVRDFLLFL